MYGLTANLSVEGTVMFSNNGKAAQDQGLSKTSYNIYEFTGHYSLNPYKKVNFLMQLGGTFATTDYESVVSSKVGVNAGLGLGMNIPTKFGLFYPVVNVRFNFMFGTDVDRVVTSYRDPEGAVYRNSANPSQKSENIADVTTIYSVPRLTIMFYPDF
jgi:hypothetical protein